MNIISLDSIEIRENTRLPSDDIILFLNETIVRKITIHKYNNKRRKRFNIHKFVLVYFRINNYVILEIACNSINFQFYLL